MTECVNAIYMQRKGCIEAEMERLPPPSKPMSLMDRNLVLLRAVRLPPLLCLVLMWRKPSIPHIAPGL